MTTEPAQLLTGLMTAHAPRPELARAFAPFSPLIGSWDLAVTWFDESKPTRRTKCE